MKRNNLLKLKWLMGNCQHSHMSFISIRQSVCLSLYPILSISLCPSICPFICLSVCPTLLLSLSQFLCPSICLPVCLSFSLCLSLYLMALTEQNFASIIKGVEMMSVQIKTVFQSGMLQLMEYDCRSLQKMYCRSVQKMYFVFSGK